MPRRYYSSTAARTTLASGVDDSTTTFTVVAVSGWPSSYPYTLIIDQDTINEEVVSVTNRSGTTLTVQRAQDGTSAVSHSAGAAVNHGVSARDFNEPNQFLNEGGTVTGPTVISSTSGTTLEVRNTGTGNSFVVEDSANPDSTPFVVDASGNVGIGTSTPSTNLNVVGVAEFSHTGGNSLIARAFNDTDGTSVNFIISKAGGTSGTPTIVASDETLGTMFFQGYNGASYNSGALIRAQVDGTPGTNDMPGRLVFSTTADGASTPTERMRITSAGNVGIGTTNPSLGRLEITGDIAATNSAVSNAAATLILEKSRSGGLVVNNDSLGQVYFVGHDGTADKYVALFRAQVDGVAAAGDIPTRFQFFTAADGTTTLTERMRINNAGLITGTGTSLGAWTAYTPTVSSGTGTFTTVSASGWWCQIGKTVHINTSITITTNGTAATNVQFSLPVTASSNSTEWYGVGRESAVTGSSLTVSTTASSATAIVRKYDNSYPGGNGYILRCSLTYQAA